VGEIGLPSLKPIVELVASIMNAIRALQACGYFVYLIARSGKASPNSVGFPTGPIGQLA
jgi:hypothetical protein